MLIDTEKSLTYSKFHDILYYDSSMLTSDNIAKINEFFEVFDQVQLDEEEKTEFKSA